jgi:hypothetical protein
LKLDPSNSYAYYYRGLALQALKKKEEACQDFLKAKELGYPEMGDVLEEYCK